MKFAIFKFEDNIQYFEEQYNLIIKFADKNTGKIKEMKNISLQFDKFLDEEFHLHDDSSYIRSHFILLKIMNFATFGQKTEEVISFENIQ